MYSAQEGASGRLRRGSRPNPPADREAGPADAPCVRVRARASLDGKSAASRVGHSAGHAGEMG
jgi:hypothetical protein